MGIRVVVWGGPGHESNYKEIMMTGGATIADLPLRDVAIGSKAYSQDYSEWYVWNGARWIFLGSGEGGGGGESKSSVTTLDGTVLSSGVVEAVGVPEYVSDVSQYAQYGITENGWYVFARIVSAGEEVTADTTVEGADGYIATVGSGNIDVAVRFEVAAMSKTVTVNWTPDLAETFVFKATDLAVRNLDYRTTFYVYDIADYAHWDFALTTDTTFAANKVYYSLVNDEYVELAEADKFALTSDATFTADKTYYTLTDGKYTAATVTTGDPVTADTYYELQPVPADTYYNHSKLTFSGMVRNVTYKLDDTVDCPIEIVLPAVANDGYGCWFEFQLRHSGATSITLVPESSDVKVATAGASAAISAGVNVVDLQYTFLDGTKLWTMANVHTTIPT